MSESRRIPVSQLKNAAISKRAAELGLTDCECIGISNTTEDLDPRYDLEVFILGGERIAIIFKRGIEEHTIFEQDEPNFFAATLARFGLE